MFNEYDQKRAHILLDTLIHNQKDDFIEYKYIIDESVVIIAHNNNIPEIFKNIEFCLFTNYQELKNWVERKNES